jgi:hypothetical protein
MRFCLRSAGTSYARAGKLYALMMFWCSEGFESVLARGRDLATIERIDRTQLSYLLLTSAASLEEHGREQFERISQALAAAQTSPIGVLGIPVGAYMDLARTLMDPEPGVHRVTEMLLPFLVPYSSAIRRCMDDQYHWERMAFPFHPAEPDTLSVLFCVESTLRWRQQPSLLRMLEGMSLGPVATNLLFNAILERFEGGRDEQRRH